LYSSAIFTFCGPRRATLDLNAGNFAPNAASSCLRKSALAESATVSFFLRRHGVLIGCGMVWHNAGLASSNPLCSDNEPMDHDDKFGLFYHSARFIGGRELR
jgi:hypothetical protein